MINSGIIILPRNIILSMVNLWEQQILWIHQICTKQIIFHTASVSWFSASSTELLAEHLMAPDQWTGWWAHWSHPARCCQLSSMAAPQEIMIFLWHAAKPAPNFWSSHHQCKPNADESPWLLLSRMSLKLVQPVGQRLREWKACPKHYHWASHLPHLGKKEVIQNTEHKSSGSYSCRGTPWHSRDVCWDWALFVMQRYTCTEVQEVRVTLEGIWEKRLFKSLDSVSNLYGFQSLEGTANCLVWPAVWQARHCIQKLKPVPALGQTKHSRTKTKLFVSQRTKMPPKFRTHQTRCSDDSNKQIKIQTTHI